MSEELGQGDRERKALGLLICQSEDLFRVTRTTHVTYRRPQRSSLLRR